jgi:hypothetical protein
MSTTYSVTRDQVITAAFRKLGLLEPGDSAASIDSNLVTNAAVVFNLMVKQWQTQGIKLWSIGQYTLPLVSGQTSYTIGPSGTGSDLTADKPLRLIPGEGLTVIRNISVTPNIDIPLQIISRQEYGTLGSKFSTGQANSVYLEVGKLTSTLNVYLTPDVNTSTNYQILFTAQKPLGDLTNSTDVPDFPNEWNNALVWGLADEMALEYDVPANHRTEIAMRANTYRTMLEDWDQEYASVFFTPNMRAGGSR